MNIEPIHQFNIEKLFKIGFWNLLYRVLEPA